MMTEGVLQPEALYCFKIDGLRLAVGDFMSPAVFALQQIRLEHNDFKRIFFLNVIPRLRKQSSSDLQIIILV